MRIHLGLLGAVLVSILSVPLMAQQTASESVGSLNAETMRPALTREGIIDVESADVGEHGHSDLGLWFWYANDPLVVVERFEDGARVNRLVSDRFGGSVTFAYSILDWMQLGFELPLIFMQDGDVSNLISPAANVTELTTFGIGDIRLLPKFRLLSADEAGVNLSFQANLVLPTASTQDNYMGGQGFWVEPAILLSRRYESGFRWAANFGTNLRSSYRAANLDIGQNIDGRFGVGQLLGTERDFGIEASVRGSFQFYPDFFGDEVENENAVEANVGIHKDLGTSKSWQAFVGGGTGLLSAPGTPDWRVFGGLRYSPRGCKDSDKDGVCDVDDECPGDPEDEDLFEDSDGCPDPDNDGDTILDKEDACPNEKEDKDGFEDEDGCPDPDNDQDGIPDGEDKCPVVAGVEARDGCPVVDRDEDGVLDTDDKCPDVRGVPALEGCPIPDQDGDGVEDDDDKCPTEVGPRMFEGCPDRDGDGFPDHSDQCPDEPEVINGVKDDDGCPDKGKTLVRLTAEKIDIKESVYFKTGKSAIQSRSFNLLNQVAAILKAHPEVQMVRIEGHTDSRGKDSYNLQLSKDRASAVREYLISKGIEAERLESEGYGETRPIADNNSEEGRQKNRRVDFFVTKQEPITPQVVE